MGRFTKSMLLAILFASVTTSAASAQLRGYTPGTGVDRNGIKSQPTGYSSVGRRTNHVVMPVGGYHYGYSHGPHYYHDNYYGDFYHRSYNHRPYGYYRYRAVYLPPVFPDQGLLFGPRAAQEFIGGGQQQANRGAQPRVNAGGGPLRLVAAPQRPAKLSNPTARAQAWKFVRYGDRHFKKGDYRRAGEMYRKAATQARDIADVYFRQAFAHAGNGRYAPAVLSMRRGLAIKPDWPHSGFVLEELFPTAEAKRATFRRLQLHLNEQPDDADALFMLALLQHFDGQPGASEVGMRRVIELTGQADYARLLLPPAEEVAADPAADLAERRLKPLGKPAPQGGRPAP